MTQKHHQYTQQLRLEAYISLKTSDHIMRLILIYHSYTAHWHHCKLPVVL